MGQAPRKFDERSSLRAWVGGSMFMLGGIWLALLVRDFFISVAATDATDSSKITFLRMETLYSAIVAVVLIALGSYLFLKKRHRKHRHSQHRSKTAHAKTAIASNRLPEPGDSDMVSLDAHSGNGKPLLPEDTPGYPGPGRAKVRVRQRVRMKIRKEKKT